MDLEGSGPGTKRATVLVFLCTDKQGESSIIVDGFWAEFWTQDLPSKKQWRCTSSCDVLPCSCWKSDCRSAGKEISQRLWNSTFRTYGLCTGHCQPRMVYQVLRPQTCPHSHTALLILSSHVRVDASVDLKRLSSTYGYASRNVSSIYVYVSQADLFNPRLRLSNWSLPSTSTSLKLVSSIYIYVSQTGLFHLPPRLSNWSLAYTSMSVMLVSSTYIYVSQTGLFHLRLCLPSWYLQSTSTSLKLVSSIRIYVSQTDLFNPRLRLSKLSLHSTSTSLKLVSSIYVHVSQTGLFHLPLKPVSCIHVYVCHAGLFHLRPRLSNWSLPSTSTSLKLVSSIYIYVSQTCLFHLRPRLSNWSLSSTSTSLKIVSSIYAHVSQTGLFHLRLRLSNMSLQSTSTSLKLISFIYVNISPTGLFHPRLLLSQLPQACSRTNQTETHTTNSSTPLTADTSNRKSAYSKKHGSSNSDKLPKVCEGLARCLPYVSHKQTLPIDTKIGKLEVYWAIEKYLQTFLTLSLNTGQW